MMHTESWLGLTDYASKYRISVSTLRRRIKGDQITFRLEDGKYYVLDVPPGANEVARLHESSEGHDSTFGQTSHQSSAQHSNEYSSERTTYDDQRNSSRESRYDSSSAPAGASVSPDLGAAAAERSKSMEAPILSTATHLLNELKRAYSSILQEKEEQLIHLKAEVADLKTLVRVLEDDNERMRSYLSK